MSNYNILTGQILALANQFGFLEANVAQIKIDKSVLANFAEWLNKKFHGEMTYLERNTGLRFNPEQLYSDTLSIICVKMPYLTNKIAYHQQRAADPMLANISSYAMGRDYHKVVKKQLKLYADAINSLLSQQSQKIKYRCFTDSAPILEIELAVSAGLGWKGKNTLLLHKQEGSMFFLGELFINLPLTTSSPSKNHCGSCTKCLTICPTNAFVEPYVLDAKRCISYLTIENKGAIPVEYRKAIGNRIYGCDECQLVCPWNKFSQLTSLTDFNIRHSLDKLSLINAFTMDETLWRNKMQGSPILRIGYEAWLRNVAVALGNTITTAEVIKVLQSKLNYPSAIVREHVQWALQQHIS